MIHRPPGWGLFSCGSSLSPPTVPLPSNCWSTRGWLQEGDSSPWLLTGWTRAGRLTLQYALPPRTAEDCTLTDRRRTVSLSNSYTVVHSISLIILLLTGFNHSFVFIFLFIFIFTNVYVSVSVSVLQSKYCTSSWEERGRQTNKLKPTGI